MTGRYDNYFTNRPVSGRPGSNRPPTAWKAVALPNELLPLKKAMLGYPSRPNLNCLPEFYWRQAEGADLIGPVPLIVDCFPGLVHYL